MKVEPKKRRGTDQRLFTICPKCKSTSINFIRKWMRISSYIDDKKVGEVHTIDHTFALTLCSKCGYSINGTRYGKHGLANGETHNGY